MAKILIIEDNRKLALFIQQFLLKKGISSDLSFDGVDGLGRFARGSYDLLLVDIKLPLMDGRTLCKKVRGSDKGKGVPVILMSGFVTDSSEIRTIKNELNASHFLTKPFSLDLLYSNLAGALPPAAASGKKEPEASEQNRRPVPAVSPSPPQTAAKTTESPSKVKIVVPAKGAEDTPAAKKSPPGLMKGHLDKTAFEDLLSRIIDNRMTGILFVGKEIKKKKFYFLGGAPVEVDAVPDEASFGKYLIHRGLISMVELRAYEESKATETADPRDIFIKMGCLSPERFIKENSGYLTSSLIECFSWKKGLFLFEPKLSFIKKPHSSGADLPHVFYEGFRKHLSPENISTFLDRNKNLYAGKRPEFHALHNHLSMETTFEIVCEMLDGSKTASEVIDAIDAEDEKALAALYTLNYLKMISFTEAPQKEAPAPPFPVREPSHKMSREEADAVTLEDEFEDLGEELSLLADELEGLEEVRETREEKGADEGLSILENELKAEAERVKECNYYEVFGLTQGSYSFNDLKTSYFDLTRKFGPEKFFASSGEIMSLAEEFLSKISTAYNTLSNVVSKESYDELLGSPEMDLKGGKEEKKFQVQIQFQSGKVFLEDGKYENALQAFTNCINIYPDKPEYYAYLALAIYNNPQHKGNKTMTNKSKELINTSLKHGKLSIAYALKGTILMDEGNLTLAESEFNKALKINPNNKTAAKMIATIMERREQEKKGLFKRMFK